MTSREPLYFIRQLIRRNSGRYTEAEVIEISTKEGISKKMAKLVIDNLRAMKHLNYVKDDRLAWSYVWCTIGKEKKAMRMEDLRKEYIKGKVAKKHSNCYVCRNPILIGDKLISLGRSTNLKRRGNLCGLCCEKISELMAVEI